MNRNKRIYSNTTDRIIDAVVYTISLAVLIITLYPFIYVLSLSFSSRIAVEKGLVMLWPVDITIASYRVLTEHPLLLNSYGNTIFYTLAGTAYSLFITITGAYACSKQRLPGRKIITLLITFTMLFSGGLIPTFLTVDMLGLMNTRGAIILPCAVSVMYLFIMRTAFNSIPAALEESALLDGANDLQTLFVIYLPLSKATIATIALFYAVGRWNDFFNALIYLNDDKLFPLQLVIRSLLVAMTDAMIYGSTFNAEAAKMSPLSFRAAVVVVTILPIMCIYPFVQRYFVSGVMIGAIKG